MGMKKIICLNGDGVGRELIDYSVELINRLEGKLTDQYEIIKVDFGGAAIDTYNHPFPEIVQNQVKQADALLLGAIGHPQYDDAPVRPEAGLLAIRKYLQLYANIRGLKVTPALARYSPIRPEIITGTDTVIVRELIGGAYFGEKKQTATTASDSMDYTKEQIERVVHYAFALAQTRKKKVTSVDKANVLATSKLWRQVVDEVAKTYPDVEYQHALVDSMAMELISHPTKFDVIVMENLFGDILSDELAATAGSLGLLPSGSFGQDGVALYEPAHGSAPDIAGRDLVNPVAMFLSVAMMFRESFQEVQVAQMIEDALAKTMEQGVVTKDLDRVNGVLTSQFLTVFYTMLEV